MLSFRLDPALLRKLDLLCIARHVSRGEVIRQSVDLFFRIHSPVKNEPSGAEPASPQ